MSRSEDLKNEVVSNIAQHYTNEEGLIYSVPNNVDSTILSESIGLYLQYLLQINEEELFQKQVELVEEYFLEENFVKWLINDKPTVNALIDDLRICLVLDQASLQFQNPDYARIAQKIQQAIEENQRMKGYYVDFYDWTYSLAADRITLSYLSPSLDKLEGSDKTIELLSKVEEDYFYPEYYSMTTEKFLYAEEVHMIDQVLIALNLQGRGYKVDAFKEWLTSEWTSERKIYGRYNRESLKQSVPYESISVYYYILQFLENEQEYALKDEVEKRLEQISSEITLREAEFFDYIHFQLYKEETK